MLLKVYTEYQHLCDLLTSNYSLGDVVYSAQVDENNTFIVYERFTFRNSNRMTLSVVASRKGLFAEVHVKSSGGGQGMIFKFDWGAGSSYQRGLVNLLEAQDIKYEIIEE